MRSEKPSAAKDLEEAQRKRDCSAGISSEVRGKEGSLERCDRKLEDTAKVLRKKNSTATAKNVLAKYQVDHKEFNGIDKPTSLPLENGENTFFPKLQHQG